MRIELSEMNGFCFVEMVDDIEMLAVLRIFGSAWFACNEGLGIYGGHDRDGGEMISADL